MNYRILLLSAYDAMSHKMWRNQLVEMFPEHSWTQLVLPPRHFNWRIRGNSLQWALNNSEQLNQDYDLLITTSMVDLSSLRGFVPKLTRLPTLLYFHENQFVYPTGNTQRSDNIEPKLVPLYSALCADAIVFNSNYNRTSFLHGARALLEKLPEKLSPTLLQQIERSVVIPVPLEEFPEQPAKPRSKQQTPILDVVWNHRWEYDKGPALLLHVAEKISQQSLPVRLHVVGQRFRSSPDEFQKIEKLLQQHAAQLEIEQGKFGFIESRADYIELMWQSDIVLSTALHDFQGLSVQEACALGCTPLVPNALVYPEYIADEYLYEFVGENEVTASGADILLKLRHWQGMKSDGLALPTINMDSFSQTMLRPKYLELFEKLAE